MNEMLIAVYALTMIVVGLLVVHFKMRGFIKEQNNGLIRAHNTIVDLQKQILVEIWVVEYCNPYAHSIEVFGPFKDEESAISWCTDKQHIDRWPGKFTIGSLFNPFGSDENADADEFIAHLNI